LIATIGPAPMVAPFLAMHKIVDIHGLSKVLLISYNTLVKNWKSLPHFFVTPSRTCKAARFDVDDVIEYLKRECGNNYDRLLSDRPPAMGGQVSVSKTGIPSRHLFDQNGCQRVGRNHKGKSPRRHVSATDDRNNLLQFVGK
jgi:hypothetical protein